MKGNVSDVGGIISDTISINTDRDNNTVISSDTFSPESGGNMNPSSDMAAMRIQGKIRFSVWKRGRLLSCM